MKKRYFLFLALFFFLIIPNKVFATTFTANGETITVTENNLIYYLYSLFPDTFNDNNYFVLHKRISDNNYFIDIMPSLPTYSNGKYTKAFTYAQLWYKQSGADFVRVSNNFNKTGGSSYYYNDSNIPIASNFDIKNNTNTVTFTANITKQDLFDYFNAVQKYTINYYINNQLYDTYEVNSGDSHTLINYSYDTDTKYFSGWQYDSNIDLTNVTQNIDIYGTLSDKPVYTITYYLDNKKYKEESVIEGNSYTLISNPDFNKYTFSFSGWQYDSNIDLTNVTQNIDITGTLTELDKTPVYVDFPISKEEFYVLLVLVANLNMILFLKWCFPFQKGGDLK